jgi:hypothetical protein
MIITGPLDHVYRHSGIHGREGVACGGRVASNPDLTVFVADAPGARIFLESEDEHAFVWTRSPSGRDECSYRSDAGLRPGFETYDAGGIRFLATEDGEHRIWIGSTGPESNEWALRIEDPWSEGASSQRWTPGTGNRVEVPIQVGPYSIAAPSNGHQYCTGFVAATPTVEIFIPRDGYGLIGVESDSDPVLYLEGPDGAVFCNDDYNGLDPGVSSYFTAGLWQVYVGSFSQGEQFSATLMLN